jgi:pre-mRNA-processing factor 17
LDPTQTQVFYNPKYEELFEPVKGPQPPFISTTIAVGKRNTLTGFVQDENINDNVFKIQYTSFLNKGFAADPTLGRPDTIVGNLVNSRMFTSSLTRQNSSQT